MSVWPKGGGGPADEVTGFNEGQTTALPPGPEGRGGPKRNSGAAPPREEEKGVPLIRSAQGRRRRPVEAVKRALGSKGSLRRVYSGGPALDGARVILFAVSGILGHRRDHQAVQTQIGQFTVGQGVQFGHRLKIDPATLRELLQLVHLVLHQIAKGPTNGTNG